MHRPTFAIEKTLLREGYPVVAGIDEAGCGALAGPVVAAAVVLPLNSRLGLIRDSKLLSPRQRARLLPLLLAKLTGYGVGAATAREIDSMGIRPASLLAMRRAFDALAATCAVDHVLVDAWAIPELPVPQRAIVRGDRLVKSIAAASIVAKTHRDALMKQLAHKHPGYGFEVHKGYGTLQHRNVLVELGPSPAHRTSFAPVRAHA
jgi:ribonuclease HII